MIERRSVGELTPYLYVLKNGAFATSTKVAVALQVPDVYDDVVTRGNTTTTTLGSHLFLLFLIGDQACSHQGFLPQ